MLSFTQFLGERKDLPDYPKHPPMKPLDFANVGTTEITNEDEVAEAGTFAQQTNFVPVKEFPNLKDDTKLKPYSESEDKIYQLGLTPR